MSVFEISDYDKSRVLIGEELAHVHRYIPEDCSSFVVVTDENVNRIYASRFPECPKIVIGTGESVKNWQTVAGIIEKLIQLGADRHTFLLGIGGGIVCDIAGYVASIYMRGIRFGYVSTSLLSQVDASIGGKTGVNFAGIKNVIGVFNQPSFVICDTNLLQTLPLQEVKNGLVELIKHMIIADASLFNDIHRDIDEIIRLNPVMLKQFISRSVQIKAEIVTRDEREAGERKKLNLGHTIGHAIESLTGIDHGHAIGIGLVYASKVSEDFDYCSKSCSDKIAAIIEALQMPMVKLPNASEIMTMIRKDKKKYRDKIDFVFIRDIGEVFIDQISFVELENSLNKLL